MTSVENRVDRLERQVKKLTEIIKGMGLMEKFVPLSQAAKQLNVNHWVLRDRIKKDNDLELGKHYIKNGSRYLVDCQEWQKLMASDVKAKRQ